jgi:hypothetical protein
MKSHRWRDYRWRVTDEEITDEEITDKDWMKDENKKKHSFHNKCIKKEYQN